MVLKQTIKDLTVLSEVLLLLDILLSSSQGMMMFLLRGKREVRLEETF